MTSPTLPVHRFVLAVVLSLSVTVSPQARADDSPEALPVEKATSQDLAAWRDLLRRGEYDALEKIADDLRATNSKYRNGRSRLWRMAWCALTENHNQMKEEDYKQAFEWLEGWLKAKPESINARLVLANTYAKYAFFARGERPSPQTTDQQIDTFAERTAAGMKALDEVADLTGSVDNVYRRLRVDLATGTGEKPDVNLAYDSLKDDPTSLEVVTGMSVLLLPRWYGEPGELEEFADEVVHRTREKCGEMHYAIAAMAVKDFVETLTLEHHSFDWKRLQQGFRDLERTYPKSREHYDDEAQFAFMADDLDAVYAASEKIGNDWRKKSWDDAGISLDRFKQRITREMMSGDQKELILGHVDVVQAIQPTGEMVISVNWDYAIRMHHRTTGERRGWIWMRGLRAESVSIHPKTGLLAGGSENNPGAMVYSFQSGRSGGLPFSDAKVLETAFPPEGDLLAAADQKGRLVVFDLKTGQTKYDFAADSPREIRGLTFSPDGKKLAAACGSGDLIFFDMETGKGEPPHKVTDHGLRSIAWSGKRLAVGTAGGSVHVLDHETRKETLSWKGEGTPLEIASLALSPDGETLAIARRAPQWDTPVKDPLLIWDLAEEKAPKPLHGHKLGVNCVQFADEGTTLLSGSNDWSIRVWNVP